MRISKISGTCLISHSKTSALFSSRPALRFTLKGSFVGDTRTQLIDVAERLFAERGIDAVSLRTVGAEAGQRNNSVAQYHFGSKQGLVDAIIEARSRAVESRRTELMEQVKRSGTPPTLETMVALLIVPLAESLATSATPTYYLRFLSNAIREPALLKSWRDSLPRSTSIRWLYRGIHGLLHDVGRADLERRLEWSAMISLLVLAERERERQVAPVPSSTLDQTVRELVAAQVALLRCPLQPQGSPADMTGLAQMTPEL